MLKQPVHIVVACDNEYVVLLAALIKSIELNTDKARELHIYIIQNNVSKANRARLGYSIRSANIQLIWKNMREVIPVGISIPVDRSSYPLDIYMRLLIPYFLPANISQALYLDVDMVVQRDLAALADCQLGDHIVAAVQDPRVKTFNNSWGGISNYRELGLAGDTAYFNTGLLLMNLAKWREFRVTEKVFECIEKNKKHANYPDQYGLNIVLANRWLQLESTWNHFADKQCENASIIHFISRKPIYKSYSNQPAFKEVFYRYLNQTHWQHFRSISEPARYFKIFSNLILKRLPV